MYYINFRDGGEMSGSAGGEMSGSAPLYMVACYEYFDELVLWNVLTESFVVSSAVLLME